MLLQLRVVLLAQPLDQQPPALDAKISESAETLEEFRLDLRVRLQAGLELRRGTKATTTAAP